MHFHRPVFLFGRSRKPPTLFPIPLQEIRLHHLSHITPTPTPIRNALSGLLPVCYSSAHVISNPNLREEMWKSSVPRPSLAVLNEKREAWG
ncbi:hypothetical protein CEXT_334511 [Caerostris extrusa]|uniref:Uncharacterized protein n=1 Tax=Caerostris extrusa TaxID=172846 RepID=A0AAV4MVU3_CAEEX|nr:hypothetical protein CEXT_334511 [Caerostris extrusa]